MAKPNYQYEKRQRELDKKRKKEEKALKKSAGDKPDADDGTEGHGQPAGEDAPGAANDELPGG